jgi:hypothetical protein
MRPGLQETGGPKNPQHKAVHHPSCLLEYLSWALESRAQNPETKIYNFSKLKNNMYDKANRKNKDY